MLIFVVVFVIIVVFVVLAATVSTVIVAAIIVGIVETGPVGICFVDCGGVGVDGRISFDFVSVDVDSVGICVAITGTVNGSFHSTGVSDAGHAVGVIIAVVFVASCSIIECAVAVFDTAYTRNDGAI